MNLSYTTKAMASALGLLVATSAATAHGSDQRVIHFQLKANPKFVGCLARYPGDPTRPPTADVIVTRGHLNDSMRVVLRNIKPGLDFDLFTVQRSTFKADGSPDPTATNRGLAWYQSDLEVGPAGTGSVEVRTILLDQIFGFDPEVTLPPTNTFHVGFWFNNPSDVNNCLGPNDPPQVTPFNGDHHAGPLAMISLPDAQSGLGPLCTNPDFSTDPPHCNP